MEDLAQRLAAAAGVPVEVLRQGADMGLPPPPIEPGPTRLVYFGSFMGRYWRRRAESNRRRANRTSRASCRRSRRPRGMINGRFS